MTLLGHDQDPARPHEDPPAPPSRPHFGEWFVNAAAGDGNPRRSGRFVRTHRITGRMNAGVCWELTDGHGDFWKVQPHHLWRLAAPEVTS